MPSWSPPTTLSLKNQKLEWQRDPRPPAIIAALTTDPLSIMGAWGACPVIT
jgi:hypothetical protein